MPSVPHNDTKQDPSVLTLERIFDGKEFEAKGFGPVRWLEDDSGYFVLETADAENDEESPAQHISYHDLENKIVRVEISAEQLTPEGAEKPLKVADFRWSRDGQRLLIFTNTKRVWRLNSRGVYWVLDVQVGWLKQLGGDAEPSTLMYAKFSPDGRAVAYVREHNIYVEYFETGDIIQLTHDGSDKVFNGISDWVYEEELHLRDCFMWSPDGRTIAYWQLDDSEVGVFHLINNTDSLYPKLIPIPYPKVGSTNPACRVGVVSAMGGDTIWLNIEGNQRDHYIHHMAWVQDSRYLIIQQINRYQNCNKVIFGDATDGSVEVVLTETDDAWVDIHGGLKLLKDGSAFTWLSDRDGWRHLYLVSRDGQAARLLTPGDFDVADMVGVDEDKGWAYLMASPENATQRYLYRVGLDGSGQCERMTPADQPGIHQYQLSPKGGFALHTYMAFDSPPVVSLISLSDHEQVKVVQGNEPLREKVAALQKTPVEFFKIPIGEDVVLDGWCIKPPDFDPNKQYPLLFYIYGEPSGLTVLDAWLGSRYLWHQMLAQQGIIVMSIDSSGSPAPRGRAWRKRMYQQVGTMSAADQAAALRVILAERPYIDPDRVGIWGWSGGGTMTLNMLFRYPELYKTGVAVAAVADQRLYDTIYQERYMGALAENEEAYIEGSPITHAYKLEGNLLLIHGTGDDNVHYQCAERLVNELIKHHKQFRIMAYPNRTHAIKEGKNTSLHLHRLMTDYLVAHLL
ncbi:MAG: S9 family peptidase [Candidatus Promineifilaceae bacterium]